MSDCMMFPETFDEFAEIFGFVDNKEYYTNGSELIPVFRVKQWLENESNRQKAEINVKRKLLDKAEREIKNQSENFKRLVAEHRDLQKLLEEKNAEIERRKNNLFCKVIIDEETMRSIVNEKVQEFELNIKSIKAEAIKELMFNLDNEISTYSSAGKDLNVYAWLKNYAKEKIGE